MDLGLTESSYEDMVARAEAVVLSMRGFYRAQLREDVQALDDIWCRLEREEKLSACIAELHAVAHNIKGQGGSFGYHLVTAIGASLSDYLRSGARTSPAELAVIHAHIKALKLVSENDICGMGGETGERIVAELQLLTT